MAVIVSLSMIFTSCEGQPSENKGDKLEINVENAEVAANMRVYYEGCLSPYFPNFAQFAFEAYTGDVVYDIEEGSLTGTGLVVQLLQAVSYEVDYFPTCTKYSPFEIVNNEVGEIFEGGAVGVQIIEIQNGQQAGSLQTQDFKAQLIASGDKMIWALEGNFDGEILTFKFEGTPQHVVGGAFSKEGIEPTSKYDGEETYAQAEVIYYGDIKLLPVNIIEVILISKDNTSFADFICYGSLDNIESVYGKYTVDVKHEVGKMAKSAGVSKEEGYVFPSFIARNYSQDGGDYYLVNAGTLTIAENEISFELTSEGGSTFTTKFNKEFTIKSYDETYGAPQSRVASLKKAIKANQPLNYNPIKLF